MMTQSPLAIIILFSFGEWESGSALGTSDFQIRHSCLPEKFAVSFLALLSDESLPHARFTVQGEEEEEVSTGSGRDRIAPDRKSEIITELGSLQLSHMRPHRFTQRLEVVTA